MRIKLTTPVEGIQACPVTGNPRTMSSFSMTFHRPSSRSRSMGVTRRGMILTLGSDVNRSSRTSACANLVGGGGRTTWP